MARPRKVLEGAAHVAAQPAPPATDDLSAIVARFKADFPAEWEGMKFGPLEYGLGEMARLLK